MNITLESKTILITGAAGFIGSFLAKRLLEQFFDVKIIGIDCITDYYDVRLKDERLKMLSETSDNSKNGSSFTFVKGDIADKSFLDGIFAQYKPAIVVNLADKALQNRIKETGVIPDDIQKMILEPKFQFNSVHLINDKRIVSIMQSPLTFTLADIKAKLPWLFNIMEVQAAFLRGIGKRLRK